jgi:hypothetical protein
MMPAFSSRRLMHPEYWTLGTLSRSQSVCGASSVSVRAEELVRDVTREILEQHGYTALVAGHPGEALLLADRHRGPIHLLLTVLEARS